MDSDRNWYERVAVFIAIYGSLELELALSCANLHQRGCMPKRFALLGTRCGEGVRFVLERAGSPSQFWLSGGGLGLVEVQTSHLLGDLV